MFHAHPHLWHVVWICFIASMSTMSALAIVSRFRKQSQWDDADTISFGANALKEPYWHRILVLFDQFINVIFGGAPGQTISARCGIWAARTSGFFLWRWIAKFMNAWLSGIQTDHGYKAAAGDLARAQNNVTYLTAALHEACQPK